MLMFDGLRSNTALPEDAGMYDGLMQLGQQPIAAQPIMLADASRPALTSGMDPNAVATASQWTAKPGAPGTAPATPRQPPSAGPSQAVRRAFGNENTSRGFDKTNEPVIDGAKTLFR
jgi:hypothetical protein